MKAVDALLSGLIDYAGLFPPAREDMRTALQNYVSYRESNDRPALGRFIVPVSRLNELEQTGNDLMQRRAVSEPWRLSVLIADQTRVGAQAIIDFNARHGSGSSDGHAVIDVAELKATTPDQIARYQSELPGSFNVYFEIPTRGGVTSLVQAIARAGARAKVRTGGVTPESIPPAEEIVDFIVACQSARVAFKATAGLHHPIRGSYPLTYEPDSKIGAMYGFLNVFVAAALIYSGEGKATAIAALGESDPRAFLFDDDGIIWRGKRVTAEQIEASRRDFATSFGSCSFREPIDELAALIAARRPRYQ